jgi:hypothetical protein
MEKTYLFIIKILTETFHLISVGKERSTRRPSAQAQNPGQLPLNIGNFLCFLIEKTCLFIMEILTETFHLISVGHFPPVSMHPEPVFVNVLRSPGLDSKESIPPGWEAIPELLKRLTNMGSVIADAAKKSVILLHL